MAECDSRPNGSCAISQFLRTGPSNGMSNGDVPETAGEDLGLVLKAFVDLQRARHVADRDLTLVWTRTDAEAFIMQAESAVAAWKRVGGDEIAQEFLFQMLGRER
jgi:hypothetical protein